MRRSQAVVPFLTILSCAGLLSGCGKDAHPVATAPPPPPPTAAEKVIKEVKAAQPADVIARADGPDTVIATLGQNRGADATRIYPSCESAGCGDSGMRGVRAETVDGYAPDAVHNAFRIAGVGTVSQTVERPADYAPRVGANAAVLSTSYPAEVDGAFIWIDSSTDAARDRFLALAKLEWDNPRGTTCSDGTRTPSVIFWKGNVVVQQQVRMLLCPTVPNSNELTTRITTALRALQTPTSTSVSDDPTGSTDDSDEAPAQTGDEQTPQASPATRREHSGIDAPTCVNSVQPPSVTPSTDSPLEVYRDDPLYDGVQLVTPGSAQPSADMLAEDRFAASWCKLVGAHTNYAALFAAVGKPNLRIGAYSVWESGRTRYFVSFDGAGNVARWSSFRYPDHTGAGT